MMWVSKAFYYIRGLCSYKIRAIGPQSKEIGIKSFISASAIGIYQSNFEKDYSEDEIDVPLNFIQKIVRDWEKKSLSVRKYIPNTSILRIGLVLSKDERSKFSKNICLGSEKEILSMSNRQPPSSQTISPLSLRHCSSLLLIFSPLVVLMASFFIISLKA